MPVTRITNNSLATDAALNNLNAGASIAFTKPVSVSGNLTVDTNTLFVDSTNNRVGIGTNNPQQAIDFRPITFNASQSGGIRFDNTSGTWPCGIYIRSDGSGDPRLSLDAPYQTNTLNLYDNNVGIGTLTPTTKLDVVGSIKASGNLTVDTNTLFVDATNDRVGIGTTTPTNNLHVALTGSTLQKGIEVSHNTGGFIRIANGASDASTMVPIIIGRGNSSANAQGLVFVGQTANDANNNYGVVSFSARNNAGTGVVGNDQRAIEFLNYTTSLMVIRGNGNVGIGTTTPNEKLHIYDSVDAHLKIAGDDTAGSIRKLSLERSTGGAEIHFNEDTRITQGLTLNTTNAAYPMSFQINGDTKMFVNTTGNVGIGTATPSEKLTVVGNISASGTIAGSSLTLQNAGTVTLTLNDTAFANIPTFNLQQAGTTRARIEGGVGLTSRMDFSVGLPISRSMSLNQGGTQNYGVTIGRSSVAGNVAPPTDGLHVQGTVAIGTTTPNEKLTVVGNISATGIVTAEGNKLAAETFAIAMAIAVG